MDDYGSYEKNNCLTRYDENKKQVWKYEYNRTGSSLTSEILNAIDIDENHYYGLLRNKQKGKDKYHLIILDIKTGKELYKKEVPDEHDVLSNITTFQTFSYGYLDNDKTFDDKIVLVGRRSSYIYSTGISRLMIDKKTFAVDVQVLNYTDLRKFIPKITIYGNVEKGYMLDPRDIFFMKDGSIGILFEKFKPASDYTAQKTSDLVYVYTDKDFKVIGSKTFEKEKSKWQNADYLFSQYINNGNDLVFFYRDFQKDDETKHKNWNLFINTLIDGKFNQEMIPISSKKNFIIFPYVAKEGYILLQEFNTTEKYNQIRLERLNY